MKNITMNDVAKKADVSLGTVSNVINNNKGVKESNRLKVKKAMEDLGYIPNLAAQAFRTNTSKVIGLIIPTITNPYYPEMAKGIAVTAHNLGYQTVLSHSERDHDSDLQNLQTLIYNRVAGIIFVKTLLKSAEIDEYAGHSKFIYIDHMHKFKTNSDIITTENEEGIAEAVNYLYTLGHRKIAYIAGDMNFESSIQRLRGYKETMKSHFDALSYETETGSFSWEYGYQRALELLASQNAPTAIVCANDLIAMGVYRAADKLSINIPSDLSVIGCDDTDLCQFVKPLLTTVYQPKYEQGELAVKILIESLSDNNDNQNSVSKTHKLPTKLIVRDSTASIFK